MPKDILPELRLADVAEFAPIANVEPGMLALTCPDNMAHVNYPPIHSG